MARTVRDANLESRTARGRLDPSTDPYYRALEPGVLHLGYRKPRAGAGKWFARRYGGGGRYSYHPLGVADDLSDADGRVILNFRQAQAAARKVMVEQAGGGVGTVADAVAAYIKRLEDDGRPASTIEYSRNVAAASILPVLGDVPLAKLSTKQVLDWRNHLARKPARGCDRRHRNDDGARAACR
jgi:hypothetical protein